MSRLIVKNIPSYVTTERLKDHFSQKAGPGGTLTDVKVAVQRDGASRRFGFVGFKTDAEARKARDWFDRTFIDATKISVHVVEAGSKDAPPPRPNKRPRLEVAQSSQRAVTSLASKGKTDLVTDNSQASPQTKGKAKADQLEEFLQVMQPRTKKGRSWVNEDVVEPSAPQSVPSASTQETPGGSRTEPVDAAVAEEASTKLDDLEWMKQHMKRSLDPEKYFMQDEDVPEVVKADEAAQNHPDGHGQPSDPIRETIMQTSRLFLRNLAFSCTGSEIQQLFAPYGDVSQVHVPLDPVTKVSKGLAFVKFAKPESAVAAYEALDKVSFQGRLLHILPAVDLKGNRDVEVDGNPRSVKGEKDKKRKEAAGREFNWSMLYMNSDAVASSIADRMNIPKADILNPQSDDNTSAAVKLALAETHIIQETKNYLESEGINIASFATMQAAAPAVRQRRSDTCILVKNIPYGTTAEQVRELFEPHGELSRVLVPPAGTIAVVEFVHTDEAGKAFRAVSYRRMGSSIVYLEKAPIGIFEPVPGAHKADKKKATGTPASRAPEASDDSDAEVNENTTVASGSTLFVKNLAFATTPERLTQVFKHLPSFAFARIQTKPDPKAPPGVTAPRLSMGYGFVGFKTPDAAKKAMSSIQGFVLDGHALQVKFAGRGAEDEESKGKEKVGARTTKMIVKNVPFEATKKEIRELFGAHGQLKSVRLPKNFNSRSRGFAFLDFVSRHEAENAYTALRHTHLLGRHLVLDWAEDTGQDVDLLRQKVGVGFGGGAELPGRKRKLDLGGDNDDDGDVDMS